MLNKITPLNKLNKHGYIFLKIDENIKKFQNQIFQLINKESKKNSINLEKTSDKKLHKFVFSVQQKINKKFNPIFFFKENPEVLKKIFKKRKYSLQHFFYLRIIKPKNKNIINPINFHRETFYSPSFFKNAFNFWIPIKNCKKNNAIFFYKNSHKFKIKKDFDLSENLTNIRRKSNSHKVGYLYKEKIIRFKKKINPIRLYKKNSLIIFSGELLHGNGINLTKKARISLDIRFIKTKDMAFNPKQGATNKKYFKNIII
tara:strand:- start:321 stop:1094 length:774 start_codon:yes stop_codon:yes gene_type:complete